MFLSCAACAPATRRVDAMAVQLAFERSTVEGKGFQHLVYRNHFHGDAVHVYIEGDGLPWLLKRFVAKDPTSANVLMLRLMALDSAPAIYLGRPCYYGFVDDPACDNRLWTSHRYSEQVVKSIAAAIRKLAASDQKIRLFGHSGGGALAVLLAERLANVDTVITVAAVLDTQSWTEEHRYTPLGGSLNPIERPPLAPSIRQWHLAGGKDKNVPAALIKAYAGRQMNAEYYLYKSQRHNCCWENIWPSILNRLKSAQANDIH